MSAPNPRWKVDQVDREDDESCLLRPRVDSATAVTQQDMTCINERDAALDMIRLAEDVPSIGRTSYSPLRCLPLSRFRTAWIE